MREKELTGAGWITEAIDRLRVEVATSGHGNKLTHIRLTVAFTGLPVLAPVHAMFGCLNPAWLAEQNLDRYAVPPRAWVRCAGADDDVVVAESLEEIAEKLAG